MTDVIPNGGSALQIRDEVAKNVTVTANLGQNILVISEATVQLMLEKRIRATVDRNAWHAPLTMVLSLLLAMFTTTFPEKALFGIEGPAWKGIFIAALVVSTVWLIRAGCRAYRTPTVERSVELILEDMRGVSQAGKSDRGVA